jgi:DNA polymerase elongation subunit (family B)
LRWSGEDIQPLRILLLDIETAPNVAHVWGLFQQNVAINQILASGYVMCWGAQWLGDREVLYDSVHDSGPKKMLKRVHALLNEADVVVHYNGKKFDIPTLQKEFATHGMLPPAPFKQVDLYRVVKEQFRFPSNKLEFVLKEFGIPGKHKHGGHSLWIRCMAGEDKAWAEMKKYNVTDVRRLAPLYKKLLPWIKQHPNHGLYGEGGPMCPSCGSKAMQSRGYARTTTNIYQRFQCKGCGSWMRRPRAEKAPGVMRRDLG